jgi:hypothetical protein
LPETFQAAGSRVDFQPKVATDDPNRVGIDQGAGSLVREAQYRTGHIVPNTREGNQTTVVGWDVTERPEGFAKFKDIGNSPLQTERKKHQLEVIHLRLEEALQIWPAVDELEKHGCYLSGLSAPKHQL